MNGYAEYERMVKETDELIRRTMLHSDIATVTVCAFLVAVICFIGWLAWEDHKEKKRQLQEQREWREQRMAMNDVEMQYDGINTYYRMH